MVPWKEGGRRRQHDPRGEKQLHTPTQGGCGSSTNQSRNATKEEGETAAPPQKRKGGKAAPPTHRRGTQHHPKGVASNLLWADVALWTTTSNYITLRVKQYKSNQSDGSLSPLWVVLFSPPHSVGWRSLPAPPWGGCCRSPSLLFWRCCLGWWCIHILLWCGAAFLFWEAASSSLLWGGAGEKNEHTKKHKRNEHKKKLRTFLDSNII